MKLYWCLTATLVFAPVAHAEVVERTTPADVRGEVAISSSGGDVHVTGWDRAEVAVVADVESRAGDLQLSRDGDRIVVQLGAHGGRGQGDLTVKVPRESKVMISTVSGDQAVTQVAGGLHLTTINGAIVAELLGPEFEARSVSGDIRGRGKGTPGEVRITTTSGDIVVDGFGSDFEIQTVSGDVQLNTREVTRARLKTTNGDLKLTAALGRDASVNAEAINGALTFNFEGTINAQFDLDTFNGEISNCFGPAVRRSHAMGPGSELRFKEGDGAARVRGKTLNGTITLCRKSKLRASLEANGQHQ